MALATNRKDLERISFLFWEIHILLIYCLSFIPFLLLCFSCLPITATPFCGSFVLCQIFLSACWPLPSLNVSGKTTVIYHSYKGIYVSSHAATIIPIIHIYVYKMSVNSLNKFAHYWQIWSMFFVLMKMTMTHEVSKWHAKLITDVAN